MKQRSLPRAGLWIAALCLLCTGGSAAPLATLWDGTGKAPRLDIMEIFDDVSDERRFGRAITEITVPGQFFVYAKWSGLARNTRYGTEWVLSDPKGTHYLSPRWVVRNAGGGTRIIRAGKPPANPSLRVNRVLLSGQPRRAEATQETWMQFDLPESALPGQWTVRIYIGRANGADMRVAGEKQILVRAPPPPATAAYGRMLAGLLVLVLLALIARRLVHRGIRRYRPPPRTRPAPDDEPDEEDSPQDRLSEIHTRFLHAWLNHRTGAMGAQILEGRFKGRKVLDLREEDILSLLREYRERDEQSARVLEALLDRNFGREWRADDTAAQEEEPPAHTPEDRFQEALKTLDLTEDYDCQTLRKRYRQLSQKFHPDRKGTNYIQKKLNEAHRLLKERRDC